MRSTPSLSIAVMFAMATMAIFLENQKSFFAEACRCARASSVFSSYRDELNTSVFRANIIREVNIQCDTGRCDRVYAAWISQTLKGCRPTSRIVYFVTAPTTAECGVQLDRAVYLLFGSLTKPALPATHRPRPTYRISSLCTVNKKWSELTEKEIEFILSRESSCDGMAYCTSGNNQALLRRCAVICPACALEPDSGLVCDQSLCRGCGFAGAEVYDAETFEPTQCPKD